MNWCNRCRVQPAVGRVAGIALCRGCGAQSEYEVRQTGSRFIVGASQGDNTQASLLGVTTTSDVDAQKKLLADAVHSFMLDMNTHPCTDKVPQDFVDRFGTWRVHEYVPWYYRDSSLSSASDDLAQGKKLQGALRAFQLEMATYCHTTGSALADPTLPEPGSIGAVSSDIAHTAHDTAKTLGYVAWTAAIMGTAAIVWIVWKNNQMMKGARKDLFEQLEKHPELAKALV